MRVHNNDAPESCSSQNITQSVQLSEVSPDEVMEIGNEMCYENSLEIRDDEVTA